MRALRAIRERKTLVESGKWHGGKMPQTAFPLSKSHTYYLGSGWRWTVVKVAASNRAFRLLVAYEPAKAQYQAWLALEAGSDQALLARLEYHPTHRGWHCHVKKGLLKEVPVGIVKQPRTREGVRLCNDDSPFNVTEVDALGIACRAFNIDMSESAGGLFDER
jgi:hypothetical protein